MTDESLESPSPRLEDSVRIGKVIRLSRLLDLYGELLTERQRDFLRLHCDEDMSFSEIAEEHSVSRQAVHDAVKHAVESLEHYEAKLKLLELQSAASAAPAAQAVDSRQFEDVLKRLREIYERLRRSGGIIYDATSLTRDLGEAIGDLGRLTSGPDRELPTER